MYQSCDCSEVEKEPEERDAMDWLMDDEMGRQGEGGGRRGQQNMKRRSQ